MIGELISRLFDGFKFSIKDILMLIIMGIFLMGGYKIYIMTENTNDKINSMEQRYFEDVEDNAFAVLASLQNNNIIEPKDIVKFLESKPAGRSDLKKGLQNDEIYQRLVNVYNGLAKNSKTALLY